MAFDLPQDIANNGAPAPDKQPADLQDSKDLNALNERQAEFDEKLKALQNDLAAKSDMLTRRSGKAKDLDAFLKRHNLNDLSSLEEKLKSQMSEDQKRQLEHDELQHRVELAESKLAAYEKERETKRYNRGIFRVVDAIGVLKERRDDTFAIIKRHFAKGEDGGPVWNGEVELAEFIKTFQANNLTWLPAQAPQGGGTNLSKLDPTPPPKQILDWNDTAEKARFVKAHGLPAFEELLKQRKDK